MTTLHDLRGDSAQVVALKIGRTLMTEPEQHEALTVASLGRSGRWVVTEVGFGPVDCSTHIAIDRSGDDFVLTVSAFGETAIFRSPEPDPLSA